MKEFYGVNFHFSPHCYTRGSDWWNPCCGDIESYHEEKARLISLVNPPVTAYFISASLFTLFRFRNNGIIKGKMNFKLNFKKLPP